MVRLILLRHGYSLFNKERRFSGHYDVPLDEIGKRQAQDAARYLVQNYAIDAVYSSDSSRAVDTVAPTANAFRLPIQKSEQLRELNVGLWAAHPFEEIAALYPEEYTNWTRDPSSARPTGGENYQELLIRAQKEIRKIANENEGKTVLIGTHGGLIRVLLCAWSGLPISEFKRVNLPPNASITVVDYDEDTVRPVLIGYADYLDGENDAFDVHYH